MRGGGGLLGLALRSDVSAELKLKDDQKTALEALRPQRGQGGQGGGQGQGQGGQRGQGAQRDPEAMRAAQAEQEKKIAGILDAAQFARLKELNIQRAGNGAIMREEVQKALGMTAEQVQKARDLQAKQREAQQSLMDKVQNGEIERDEVRTIMQKNQGIMNEELGKILTPAQTEALKKMGGAPFKFDDQA